MAARSPEAVLLSAADAGDSAVWAAGTAAEWNEDTCAVWDAAEGAAGSEEDAWAAPLAYRLDCTWLYLQAASSAVTEPGLNHEAQTCSSGRRTFTRGSRPIKVLYSARVTASMATRHILLVLRLRNISRQR